MREYETVFVLHPHLEDARVEEEIEGVQQTIAKGSGEVLHVARWGRRRLAYEIQKVHEGIYTLIRFRSEPQVLQDLERRYRLREEVLRHLTVVAQGPIPETQAREQASGTAEEVAGPPPAGGSPVSSGASTSPDGTIDADRPEPASGGETDPQSS